MNAIDYEVISILCLCFAVLVLSVTFVGCNIMSWRRENKARRRKDGGDEFTAQVTLARLLVTGMYIVAGFAIGATWGLFLWRMGWI